MDRIDAVRRSQNMAAIRRKNTRIERRLRSALWASGIRGYRVDSGKIAGRPDIAFGPARVAVFVDGCFWHRCPRCYKEPKSNTEYWRQKMGRNVARDRETDRQLLEDGWTVIRLWEHEVEGDLPGCVGLIGDAVRRR